MTAIREFQRVVDELVAWLGIGDPQPIADGIIGYIGSDSKDRALVIMRLSRS